MAMVVLKGKTQAIEVWEPLHDHVRSDGYVTRYCEAYATLKAGSPEAMRLFEALAEENPVDPCVLFHLERIEDGAQDVLVKMEQK
jgi:adenylate cyclase